LRAERSGQGPGRTYRLIFTASDASGNQSSVMALVTVPHDLGTGPEPLLIGVEPDGAHGTAHRFWNAVPGAGGYDIITGDVASLRMEQDRVSLGTVQVPARLLTTTSWSESTTGSVPEAGHALFYLMQYRDASGPSGFGTESTPLPSLPDACAGG